MISAETPQPGKARWLRSLAQERPDLAKEWAQDKNGDVTAESIPAASSIMAAWRCARGCKDCGRPHEWHTTVFSRYLGGTGCPFCTGNRVCPCQSLSAKHKALMDDWDHEVNKGLDPESMACQSHTRVSWKCQKCGHKWSAQVVVCTWGVDARSAPERTGCGQGAGC